MFETNMREVPNIAFEMFVMQFAEYVLEKKIDPEFRNPHFRRL